MITYLGILLRSQSSKSLFPLENQTSNNFSTPSKNEVDFGEEFQTMTSFNGWDWQSVVLF